ncbi:HAMP domain-containing sensor histidine kinase [Massilia sp. CF038]|uniref:HAMP domain-containing sensor histidine kinase n=1 Tax=Massilia sp. CF038 TaxID=1881045 RepID=UPI00091799CE|nr:HAMP domain-containing sensor histidine kinase [Massilia sp. CF038]SHH45842.1 Signal transduction histidine kinase [Massilia sp. CF038]
MRKGISLSHRLYVRIYLALLASLVALGCMFAVVHWLYATDEARNGFDTFAEVASEVLPPASASPQEQRRALMRWRMKVRANMALYTPAGELIAGVGPVLPPLPSDQTGTGRIDGSRGAQALKLSDGRWLVWQRMHGRRFPVNILLTLAAVACVVAIGAFPVVRRLTSRLERLQSSVDTWGSGQLSTRVAVEGKDEVALLASSFNDAAQRIEALVQAQKNLLANASHELRSPLARIRMAVELLQDQANPAISAELRQNIAELDLLIDEVLLASRLDASAQGSATRSEVDLAAIVAEECSRVGAVFDVSKLTVQGDARLLRRLLRNLLENAKRYGDDTPVKVNLTGNADGGVVLDVCDGGPGVPAGERERIFEPFYRLPGASEAAGGVGLGLSLVRQIAQHHGGQVQCLPAQERGCCFRVSLPGGREDA